MWLLAGDSSSSPHSPLQRASHAMASTRVRDARQRPCKIEATVNSAFFVRQLIPLLKSSICWQNCLPANSSWILVLASGGLARSLVLANGGLASRSLHPHCLVLFKKTKEEEEMVSPESSLNAKDTPLTQLFTLRCQMTRSGVPRHHHHHQRRKRTACKEIEGCLLKELAIFPSL